VVVVAATVVVVVPWLLGECRIEFVVVDARSE
jgi:hypothetical protein